MKSTLLILIFLSLYILSYGQSDKSAWTGTFAAAMEYTGNDDMPQRCTLSGNTIRQIVHVSIGGKKLRIQLSNEFGDAPVEIRQAYIASVKDSSVIIASTARYLLFNGKRNITIPAGKSVWSDEMPYTLEPLQRLSITLSYGNTPVHMTSHRGSRTYSYIALGHVKPNQKYKTIEKVAHWYNIAKISVNEPVSNSSSNSAIAVLGNSITDGRGSTTDAQNRWTDRFAEALNGKVAVLNLGIGGNCVVSGGISQPAMLRFDRDILGQDGINRLIIFEGVNDIGSCPDSLSERTARNLINAYKELAGKAHAHGLKVYGATITPFKGNNWYSFFHEAARQMVNDWIRTTNMYDGIIDFDTIVRDPQQPDRLLPEYSDDWLHLNPKGYEAMGKYAATVISNN